MARAWGLTPGRISQFVSAGMPLTSLAAAKMWRRASWDIPKSGPVPEYLLLRKELVSLEQDVYDQLVYRHGVSREIAAKVAFGIFCRREYYPRGVDFLRAGEDRPFVWSREENTEENTDGTWFVPIIAADLDDHGYSADEAREMLAEAEAADRAALAEDPEFDLPEENAK